MDHIPKIFVINLPHRVDRLESIKRELDRMGMIDKMELVEGVILDGYPESGIAEAHARCLELAQQRGYEMIMILQDDCKFLVNKESFNAELTAFFNTAPDDWNGLWPGAIFSMESIETYPHNWVHPPWFHHDTGTIIPARSYSQFIEAYRFCRDKYIETKESIYNIDRWVSSNIQICAFKQNLCCQADNYSDRMFTCMFGGGSVPL